MDDTHSRTVSLCLCCPPPPIISSVKTFSPNLFWYDITAPREVKIILDIFIIHPLFIQSMLCKPVLFADKICQPMQALADRTSKGWVPPGGWQSVKMMLLCVLWVAAQFKNLICWLEPFTCRSGLTSMSGMPCVLIVLGENYKVNNITIFKCFVKQAGTFSASNYTQQKNRA